jgi:hypothetical protein
VLGGRFVVEQAILDAGGQGNVKRAIDRAAAPGVPRIVALKIVENADEEVRRRILREYRILREHPHDHVIPVIAFGEEADGSLWYAMPLARQSLETRLESGVLKTEDAVGVVRQVGHGVTHLHGVGVIHRDIKPGNVLESSPGRWVVSDLGFARHADSTASSRLTASGAGLGTLWYTAPEQWIDAHRATERSDIFSLGRLTQDLLLGYESDLDDLNHEAIRAVLRRATSADPNARQTTVDAFVSQLENAATAPESGWAPAEAWDNQRERLLRDLHGGSPDPATNDELRSLMSAAVEDAELMERFEYVATAMPADMIEEIWNADRGLFRRFLDAYARHVGEVRGYDFSFTDHVANFWHRCAQVTGDPQVRGLAVSVLGELGPRHNRWHVRDVFAALVQEVHSADDAIYSEEALRGLHRADLEWSVGELDSRTLHPLLHSAIESALAEDDEA